jgi:hypothetical protein
VKLEKAQYWRISLWDQETPLGKVVGEAIAMNA